MDVGSNVRRALLLAVAIVVPGCAPTIPERSAVRQAMWLEQGWSGEERYWFHHTSQGTGTLPVPYAWFIALEQPSLHPFGAAPLFKDPGYLSRFGFIPSPASPRDEEARAEGYSGRQKAFKPLITAYAIPRSEPSNPDGLPVGFARLKDGEDPVTGETRDLIGFTCAACHTGQLEYRGVSIRIDGGPAMVDLGKFRESLRMALIYTWYVPLRFGRFADRVLGTSHTDADEAKLKEAMGRLLDRGKRLGKLTERAEAKDVDEGFGRLDALSRIGNQIFFQDMLHSLEADDPANAAAVANLRSLTAPVNFPHLWDTPWFDWVQYDSSIMQPMIRNAGEALGVSALLNLNQPGINLKDPNERMFKSTAAFNELFEMESLIGGTHPHDAPLGFKGLRHPRWPEDVLGAIDGKRRDEGEVLYRRLCQGCHLPPPSSDAFWDKPWTAIGAGGNRYLKLHVIDVGTDPLQGAILAQRRVQLPAYLGIDPGVLCGGTPTGVVTETTFAEALAAVVEKTTDYWYKYNGIAPSDRERMNGYRPNCVRAGKGYKARPLDGVWATAPFLHNGSVPNLYELLSPRSERTAKFSLGGLEFDPVKVGYQPDDRRGTTTVDTSKPGNSNQGHEFRDEPGHGRVGPRLTPEERMAIIEYLKSM